MDTYERTYSQLLQVQLANDRAIAAALSEDEEPRPAKADTSLDGQLALQLHEKEVEKLGECSCCCACCLLLWVLIMSAVPTSSMGRPLQAASATATQFLSYI
jgi:hypothetical protein